MAKLDGSLEVFVCMSLELSLLAYFDNSGRNCAGGPLAVAFLGNHTDST